MCLAANTELAMTTRRQNLEKKVVALLMVCSPNNDRDPGSFNQDVGFCVLAYADDVDVAGNLSAKPFLVA